MISIIITILNHKIKTKNNKTLIKAFIRTFNKIFDENYMILSNSSDEIKIDQKIIFSSKNTIIAEKIIFVLIAVIQIIQFTTANTYLTWIKHLQKTIKWNHSLSKHDQKSMSECISYMLVTLAITIKVITMFILLLMKITNLTLIDHTSTQKTNQTFSQKSEAEIYFFTWNWWLSNQENC